jgi:hypothetical protein
MILAVAATLVVASAALPASAIVGSTLTDGNSSVTFNPASSALMSSWIVDSVQQLKQQTFFYRVGSSGPELPLTGLTLGTVTASGTGSTGGFTTLDVPYTGAGFTIDVTYVLTGGQAGSRGSAMNATIKVVNTSPTSPLDFHFFQYADFDLSGADQITINNGRDAFQTSALGHVSEVITTPLPSHHAAGLLTDPSSIYSLLTDGLPTTLSDASGPSAAGDATWAFEWDQSIAANGTLLISKSMSITPEPATLFLLGAGLVIGLRKRRG